MTEVAAHGAAPPFSASEMSPPSTTAAMRNDDMSLDADMADGDLPSEAVQASMKNIYLAVYSNVAVYELMARGTACMRRRSDGYINATQILKVAGIDKAKRTKILEKEILTGKHEKVQGGYGKYQGTWIPLKRAQELSATYNVAHILAPLLEFDPSKATNVPVAGPRKRANPNAPSASAYYRTGPGAAQAIAGKSAVDKAQAMASGAASLLMANSSAAGPSQQPRFVSLRPPPGADGSSGLNGMLDAGTLVFPRGSTAEQRDTLSGYASHGYTPQGVTLPPAQSASAPSPVKVTDMTNGSKAKRGADAAFDVAEDRDPKRQRGSVDRASATMEMGAAVMGPSPVKDLNALGRSSSPTSALRGARAPTRLHRVALGPPDKFRQLQLDGTRFADRPQTLHEGDEGERRMRAKLLQLFVEERLAQADADDQTEHVSVRDEAKLDVLSEELREAVQSANELDGLPSSLAPANGQMDMSSPPPCVDLVIDDHGHTALHWSSALAKVSHVRMLTARAPSSGGANTHAGNHGGETALHRTVLVSNAYDTSSFPALLHLLAPSLHTRDYRKRTVLHHIALIASVKGRAVAARYYLTCVLEYIAKYQGGRYGSLIDAQDDDGETALSIVARAGNVSMVKALLDVGARKDIANDLGLKASDWGIDGLNNQGDEAGAAGGESASNAKDKQPSEAVTALTRPPHAPVQKSKDVLEQMTTVLSDLTDVFQKEITDKEEAFNVAQAHLQSATRELAIRRRRINESQAHVAERDEVRMRRENLAKTLREEMGLASDGDESACVAQCLAIPTDAADVEGAASDLTREVPFRDGSSDDELFKLRWLASKYETGNTALQRRIDAVADAQQAKTDQCRKVVAMCCGVAEDKVEGMLDELVQAIESIGSEGVDLQRLAGFLSKVKETRS